MIEKENSPPIYEDILGSSWEENIIFKYISQYGKLLIIFCISLIIVLALAMKIISSGSGNTEQDYLHADQNVRKFAGLSPNSKSLEAQEEGWIKTQNLLTRHPDLQTKYDGDIAQILISRGNIDLATPITTRSLERTKKMQTSEYKDFAKTTLLINQKNYNEALDNALILQQKLETNRTHQDKNIILKSLNLLRIAALQNELNLKNDERISLKEWQEFAKEKENPFLTLLKSGETNFEQYIQYKLNLIK